MGLQKHFCALHNKEEIATTWNVDELGLWSCDRVAPWLVDVIEPDHIRKARLEEEKRELQEEADRITAELLMEGLDVKTE